MTIDFHRNFDKSYKKLPANQKNYFKTQLAVFVSNRYSPELNNHGLKGKYQGYRSINIGGDLRAIFYEHSDSHIEFITVGTHAQLYN